MKARKKPVVVDVFHMTNKAIKNVADWPNWLKFNLTVYFVDGELCIKTLEGLLTVSENDWIIKGVKGEIYPCKPDVFERTYDIVKEE